jgi:hypothetical protein
MFHPLLVQSLNGVKVHNAASLFVLETGTNIIVSVVKYSFQKSIVLEQKLFIYDIPCGTKCCDSTGPCKETVCSVVTKLCPAGLVLDKKEFQKRCTDRKNLMTSVLD